ncbi:cytochrome c oxidase subunit II [Natronolimnohabitans innermongolicus]|uniref:Cytochrome c oxidase subunit II n=1 Tax=Natronolimnohabitans innermongolicus JCM 12255 TaxID=1227499 RepID=L9X5Z9_9EURY|nr:cytochrome c oxidase subunit II [Natronolimnohabitans innermongolicus]ELY57017.1 cytochrome c oxidase subunit II [Natronolimnohabitans innermongolicus JCM 12255]
MNIHTYEKLWLIAAMVLIVGFIATITYGSVALGITMVGDQEDTIEPRELSEDDRFGEPRVEQVGENEYEAYVVARTFMFQPDPIEIPENSEVTFYVTARDVIHSFSVAGTNINTMAIPGEIATMTAEFDEPGEYGIVCNEYCGSGHHNMEGELHVLPEDEFDLTELSVEADDEVALEDDDEVTLEIAVENGQLEDLETTIEAEIGDETFTEDVTVEGDSTYETTVSVDAADLGEGDHDWSVTVDDYEESGTVTVVDQLEDDGGDDDE